MGRSSSSIRLFLVLALLLLGATGGAEAAPPEQLARAAELVEARQFDAARELLSGVEDTSGWLDYLTGRVRLAADELDPALESLSRAVELSAETALFQRWLGEAYIEKTQKVNAFSKLGLAKKGLAALSEAARLDPSDFETRETLVGYYLNAPGIAGGGADKARAEAQSFMKLSPSEGHSLMGQIHMHDEEYDKAASAYAAAAEVRPDDPRLRFRVGMLEQQREHWDAAFAAFEKAIELDNDYMDAYYQLGRTAIFGETNLERAVECMQTFLATDHQPNTPGHEHAHWRLGMIYQLKGDNAAARSELEAALAIDPKHSDAKKALKSLPGS